MWGLLPASSGSLLGWLALRSDSRALLFRGTGIAAGEPSGALARIELAAVAAWGEPTGVALSPDGETIYLGQRRRAPRRQPSETGGSAVSGLEERLVEVALHCKSPDPSM